MYNSRTISFIISLSVFISLLSVTVAHSEIDRIIYFSKIILLLICVIAKFNLFKLNCVLSLMQKSKQMCFKF